jgi:hypothetical protein
LIAQKLEKLYTPLTEAKDEIRRRWADLGLRKKVEEYLGVLSPGMGDESRAFYCRTVLTPHREFHRFIALACEAGLTPVGAEYLDDCFNSLNPDKLGLVRMTFLKGRNRLDEPIFKRKMVTGGDINGKSFTSILTLWGENLVDFHHRSLRTFFPDLVPVNEYAWIRTHGTSPRAYYPANFARFICHGILFENFLVTNGELAFTRDVVIPAFETVTTSFGMKPLIVRLLPQESENDPSWTWYDTEMEHLVSREMLSTKN